MQNLDEIDFHQIRTLEGGQDVAFEEFCCQIARRTKDVPLGSKFIRYRGAGGDGGVECVWQLSNGEEWGWQAKYIFTLDKAQLDRSVKTALTIHPKLTRYTVCLPFNFTGPTGRRGKSDAEKYAEYEQEWQMLAERRGMRVKFGRLCKSELLDELLKFDPNYGRLRFWFDAVRFGDKWFENHLKDTTKAAEPRYTPALTVKVPVAAAFEALGRTSRWEQSVCRLAKKIDEAIERWSRSYSEKRLGPEELDFPFAARESAELLGARLSTIRKALKNLLMYSRATKLISELSRLVGEARELASKCLSTAIEDLEAKYGKGVADSVGFRQYMAEYMVSFPARHVDAARDVEATLEQLYDWLNETEACLPMSHAMLLLGPAGVGKTHAICDIALDRHRRELRSIVLLGERFNYVSGEPWERIRSLLGLSTGISRDELFGILDAAGESTGYPCIIFVDALNETKPRKFWYDSLSSLVEQVSNYDWLKLCVSCRSTYYDDVIASNVRIPEVEHTGFAGIEFDACLEFFHFYGLEPPSMPLMQPEFSNPLFLRLTCESLKDAGVKRLPEETMSISRVISYFLNSKNEKLAQVLNYNRKERFVHKALDLFISAMQEAKTRCLPWSTAKELVDSIWPPLQRSSSLFDHLIMEGLIREDRVVDPSTTGTQEVIFISFERLAEYLLAEKYVAEMSKESLHAAFAPEGTLNFTISDDDALRENRGLLEALSVQIPDKYGLELSEVVGERSSDPAITLAVVESLVWRADGSIGRKTEEIVKMALGNAKTFASAMETLFALSSRSGNPLNALWFHSHFSSIPMPDRDAALCPYLHNTYGKRRGLDRLLRWSLDVDLAAVSHETAELWSTQLCWFCTSSDRRIRDHATKGIVRIMESHVANWPQIIKRFCRVDDEYVIERCLAAAYGSLIRANRDDAIREAALTIYEVFFKNGLLPQNAMVRDYARLVLELAAIRNLLPEHVGFEHFRPPYKSEWPLHWPEETFVEQYKDSYKELPKLYRSCLHDDFAVYTVPGALEAYEGLQMPQAQRWIFKHVLDMGYTTSRFANFDGYMLAKYGPGRAKPPWAERIGKKYQWIALYRLMARVADNLRKESFSWDPSPSSVPALQALEERNIDPTILIKGEQRTESPAWWAPIDYGFKAVDTLSDNKWLDVIDFPDSAAMLKVVDPSGGREWAVLEAHLNWRSKSNDDAENRYPYRHIWMQLRSYFVRRADYRKCWNWLCRQNFMGRWMPEGFDLHDGFLGEYPWGLPFAQFFEQMGKGRADSNTPCVMMPTTHSVSCNYEFDAYQQGNIDVLVPAQVFFTQDNLHWDGVSGYRSDSGKLCFTYPAALDAGPSALLVDLKHLAEFLEKNNLVLAWTILAEKRCIDGFTTQDLGYAEHSRAHMLIDGKIKSSKGITHRVRPRTKP